MLNKDVIVACDFPCAKEVFDFLDAFKNVSRKPFVKIGMELYYAEGAEMVREIRRRGHSIFLDLKLHDIPTTVKRAMAVLSSLDVDMVNVHAAGGSEMMKAAKEGLCGGKYSVCHSNAIESVDQEINDAQRAFGTRCPKLIAVTQLTSTSEQVLHDELLIGASMPETIISYAKNAAASGLDGVVCSPLEAGIVHKECGNSFLTVTPGVRFADGEVGDQKRVMTPAEARKTGSDYIVVGRPITRAENPLKAYERCINEFLEESLM